jgi:hypothetical protein
MQGVRGLAKAVNSYTHEGAQLNCADLTSYHNLQYVLLLCLCHLSRGFYSVFYFDRGIILRLLFTLYYTIPYWPRGRGGGGVTHPVSGWVRVYWEAGIWAPALLERVYDHWSS